MWNNLWSERAGKQIYTMQRFAPMDSLMEECGYKY